MRFISTVFLAVLIAYTPAFADDYPVKLRVTDSSNASADQDFTITVNVGSTDGTWLRIPARSSNGVYTPAFIVMKHLARLVSGVATSTPAGSPSSGWSHDTARNYCQALGTGYGLMTVGQYMSIAHDALNQAANWTGAAIGSGRVMNGYYLYPQNHPAASSNDAQGYINVPSPGEYQRRTLLLSTGGIIWDMGNGPTVVSCDDGRPGCTGASSANANAFFGQTLTAGSSYEFNTLSNIPSGNADVKPGNYTSAQGVGRVYIPASSGSIYMGNVASLAGVYTTNAGLFEINIGGPTSSYLPFFRCTAPAN